ncbi:MAG TPA: phosphatase PAP2 family protein [Candidatus Methylacidiphilales bacterium]|nr:phosphatase PAP2 family protein [Candidatus Methylacidiphilales bacterium]
MSLPVWFHTVDLHLLYLINVMWSRPWLDPVMAYASDWDTWRIPVIIAVALTLIFGRFRARLFLILMAACLLIGDKGISDAIKATVQRPRPNETEPHIRVVTIHGVTESVLSHPRQGNSFTSGHACNNVALAFMACSVFGWRAAWVWLWAALVSYSRIYTGSHYPSDILGSWLIALLYSYFICRIAAWVWRRYGPVKFPELHARHPVLFPLWEK